MQAKVLSILSAAGLVAVAACSTAPEQKPAAEAAPAPAATATPRAAAPRQADPSAALKDPNNVLSKRSVYFDYDKYDIKPEFKPLVEAHAQYLRANPGAKMLIQGNADERGSREYNVGLGQRRSDTVKRALLLLGAKEAQIEAVSLGEEKPVCTDHAEGCWSKNRRDDMLYSGEY
jgi:peptidoglycan-associated lipoprotein